MTKRKIFIISNRLPINIIKKKEQLKFKPSAGGLATGLSSLYKKYSSQWMGWPGIVPVNDAEKKHIVKSLKTENMLPVFLSKQDIDEYYEGFSNRTIWPLFHYFTQYSIYNQKQWDAYIKVNKVFCEELTNKVKPNDIIWIHDYHLMLLPKMIRERTPNATIGFFLHIPFPSFEIFRLLPWRKEILEGLLGADLIGFHTYDYGRHFVSSVTQITGYESKMFQINHADRITRVDCFPMGIDYEKFASAPKKQAVIRERNRYLQRLANQKIILSIDRLDYSKGLLERLDAFHQFLHDYPEYREKISLVLVVVPSRAKVESYRKLKHQLDEYVGRINGEHGTVAWLPIIYMYRSFSFNTISALYSIADIALITPLRDGMNLVAKEYIANKNDSGGVLILSELAGSAGEMGEALLINPNNQRDIIRTIKNALEMPEDEQLKRNKEMQTKLKRYNINRWGEDFIERLNQTKQLQSTMVIKRIHKKTLDFILDTYDKAERRLIFLDYDGTLVPFKKNPEDANPDGELINLLNQLSISEKNELVLISGRDKNTMNQWFGDMDFNLVAEHGAWLRQKNKQWNVIEPFSNDWKKEIYPVLELYVERTPGSFIEEKEFSLVWHYRKADVGLGELRARELTGTATDLTGNLDLQILEGNKIIEVKNSGINKGRAALNWLKSENWSFVLAIGDDWTDEDLFKVLPDSAFSIRVGFKSTLAKHNIKSFEQVRNLLRKFVQKK
ncbi:bifunctional alpha,alpha-trehalose-phosphate synthase (UDP-forming)/trehalose-phosphatase [candidate division KSB1 bacterium]|nr:bifunctional alpha,alpha-trehalose-phosphate synthase (UDP-forming)/trehalose-phosphatase [candidate division KSB1 bacterium]